MINTTTQDSDAAPVQRQLALRREMRPITMEQFFNTYQKYRKPPMQLVASTHKPPTEIVVMIFNRKLSLRDRNERMFKRHEPVHFGTQFPILATARTTGRELYEQVWARVRSQLKLSCHDRNNLWWNRQESIPMSTGRATPLKPFVLKHVDTLGISCSICHWSRRCHGCAVEPGTADAEQLKLLLLKNTYLACEWDIDFFES